MEVACKDEGWFLRDFETQLGTVYLDFEKDLIIGPLTFGRKGSYKIAPIVS